MRLELEKTLISLTYWAKLLNEKADQPIYLQILVNDFSLKYT